MGKDVLVRPAGEVEPHPIREKAKTSRRQLGAPLTEKDGVELLLERMQVQNIGRGIGELGVAERLGAPIGELLLLRQIDAQQFADQVLETVLVAICTGDAGGDLGAIEGERHDSQMLVQHGKIETGEMKNFEYRPIGEKLGEIGRLAH